MPKHQLLVVLRKPAILLRLLSVFCANVALMGRAFDTTALDGLLEPLSRCLDAESARRLIEFRIAPEIQARVDVLAGQANEGVLTGEEKAEYEAVVNAADFISVLKLKAQRYLNASGGS